MSFKDSSTGHDAKCRDFEVSGRIVPPLFPHSGRQNNRKHLPPVDMAASSSCQRSIPHTSAEHEGLPTESCIPVSSSTVSTVDRSMGLYQTAAVIVSQVFESISHSLDSQTLEPISAASARFLPRDHNRHSLSGKFPFV